MFIKTLRKRIALVAVSALGVGVLSAAPASSAVAIGDIDFSTQSDIVNVGACTITNTNVYGTTVATFRSGSNVRLVRTTLGDAADGAYLTLSGPAIFASHSLAGGGTAGATVTPTTITDATSVAGDLTTITLTGVGTVVMTYAANAASAPIDVITITSVAACANNTYSAIYSDVSAVDSGTDAAWTANVDEATQVTAGGSLYLRIDGDNAYDSNLTTGTWTASATNGALVAYGSTIGTAVALAGTTSSVSTTDGDGSLVFRIDPASQAAGATTVVTVTHNGTAVTTKTLTFFGEAKSIKVMAVKSGARGGTIAAETATGYFLYRYLDAAGSAVPGSASAFATTSATVQIPTAASVKAPSIAPAAVADAATGLVDATETAIGSVTDGVFAFTCAATSGSSTITIAHVNAVTGDTITVNQEVTCAGGIATYEVSADKASYKVGEVATFTITAKDSSGKAVADSTVMAVDTVSVGGGTLTRAVAATDLFSAGVRTVKAQMTTAGTFNAVVSLTGSVTTSATASYTVTDGAVSNADVLKSIVALIASINKQIQALQKLILKR